MLRTTMMIRPGNPELTSSDPEVSPCSHGQGSMERCGQGINDKKQHPDADLQDLFPFNDAPPAQARAFQGPKSISVL